MKYKGLMKLGPNSFVNEYKNKQELQTLNKWFWKLTPWLSGLAAITATLNFFANLFKWW